MPGKLLPDHKLQRWLAEGKSYGEIVRLLEEEDNIVVTRQAISAWKRRRGEEMNPQPESAMPWRLRPEHRQMEPARVIRLWARRQRGDDLRPEDEARLTKAVAHLEAVGGVFHYNPDTAQGWWITPRRPGIDTGIVRELQHP